MTVAAVILAAGGSRRLGQAKQLLVFEGRTLLRRAVAAAAGAGCEPVVVVLGAHAEEMRLELTGTNARTAFNADWADGMGSSVSCGMKAVLGAELQTVAVLIMLCDQPLIGPQELGRLITAFHKGNRPVAASEYFVNDETVFGVPAVFGAELFSELSHLTGDRGAKAVIAKHKDRAAFVSMPEAAIDIDTEADLQRLRKLTPF